jgi:haloacetate dehalogenase
MPDLADLYPGFASHWIDTSAGRIFARTGGSGPPLMLLHGYAQTNVMWHKVADELAKDFAVAIDCGHYLPEENPHATAAALIDFFSGRE